MNRKWISSEHTKLVQPLLRRSLIAVAWIASVVHGWHCFLFSQFFFITNSFYISLSLFSFSPVQTPFSSYILSVAYCTMLLLLVSLGPSWSFLKDVILANTWPFNLAVDLLLGFLLPLSFRSKHVFQNHYFLKSPMINRRT